VRQPPLPARGGGGGASGARLVRARGEAAGCGGEKDWLSEVSRPRPESNWPLRGRAAEERRASDPNDEEPPREGKSSPPPADMPLAAAARRGSRAEALFELRGRRQGEAV